jgi:hypothetical protein
MKSTKQIQSELGLTGECSEANMELINKIGHLTNKFDHTHDSVTEDDSFIMMANINMGHKYGEEGTTNPHFTHSMAGCPHNMVDLFTSLFYFNPEMMMFAQHGMMQAALLTAEYGKPKGPVGNILTDEEKRERGLPIDDDLPDDDERDEDKDRDSFDQNFPGF